MAKTYVFYNSLANNGRKDNEYESCIYNMDMAAGGIHLPTFLIHQRAFDTCAQMQVVEQNGSNHRKTVAKQGG